MVRRRRNLPRMLHLLGDGHGIYCGKWTVRPMRGQSIRLDGGIRAAHSRIPGASERQFRQLAYSLRARLSGRICPEPIVDRLQ